MHTFILGGQRSGKSLHAEGRVAAWLRQDPDHRAIYVATARAGDTEMAARIARHQAQRRADLPAMQTREVPLALAAALRAHSTPRTLILVDCLTLWLCNHLMPQDGDPTPPSAWDRVQADLCRTLSDLPGPVVLVSTEIGMGVVPWDAATRQYVDALGLLHQAVAAHCAEVMWVAAGLALPLKGAGPAT